MTLAVIPAGLLSIRERVRTKQRKTLPDVLQRSDRQSWHKRSSFAVYDSFLDREIRDEADVKGDNKPLPTDQ
jgi:hypothetical protein